MQSIMRVYNFRFSSHKYNTGFTFFLDLFIHNETKQ